MGEGWITGGDGHRTAPYGGSLEVDMGEDGCRTYREMVCNF